MGLSDSWDVAHMRCHLTIFMWYWPKKWISQCFCRCWQITNSLCVVNIQTIKTLQHVTNDEIRVHHVDLYRNSFCARWQVLKLEIVMACIIWLKTFPHEMFFQPQGLGILLVNFNFFQTIHAFNIFGKRKEDLCVCSWHEWELTKFYLGPSYQAIKDIVFIFM
jgi:hypothetical protein